MSCVQLEVSLLAIANAPKENVDLGGAVFALVGLDWPQAGLTRYQEQLDKLSRDIAAIEPTGAALNRERSARALTGVVAQNLG